MIVCQKCCVSIVYIYIYHVNKFEARLLFLYLPLKNGSKSNDQYISCGVPQGSILGPLIFILYINDLSNISESLTSILFADDTTVIVESDSVSDAIALMNLELIKLNIWLQANKLTLNTTKTHYMVFDRGKKQSENNLLTLNNKFVLSAT